MLSCCMIVQDEEQCIHRALNSVHDYVDEIIVVDGGSRDKTMEMARSYEKVKLFERPFPHDFANQRNYAIEQASGEWIFTLDADEECSPLVCNQFQHLINLDYDAYAFTRMTFIDGILANCFDDDLTYRLFRNYCRYEGYVSEGITGFKNAKRVNLHIIHTKTAAWQQKDNETYWDMGLQPPPGWEKLDKWRYITSRNGYAFPNFEAWPADDLRHNTVEEPQQVLSVRYDAWMTKERCVVDSIEKLGISLGESVINDALGDDLPSVSALDIGCANGAFLLTMLRRGRIKKATGIDISPAMIQMAEAGAAALGLEIDVSCSSIEEFSTEQKFDLVCMSETLEHLYSPRKAIARVISLLAPGGVFGGTIPEMRTCDAPGHLHYFTEDSLRDFLSAFFPSVEITLLNYTPNADTTENHLVFVCRGSE